MNHLRHIALRQFKCFADQEISLSAATVLTGLNGMGKSSVIQALLLLRQSERAGLLRGPDSGLLLNGDLIRLGTAEEVLYEGASDDTLTLTLGSADGAVHAWRFRARSERAQTSPDLLPLLTGPAEPPPLVIFGSRFYYLGAERMGPRPVHALSSSQTERHDFGADGVYAVSFLDANGDQHVLPPVRHPDAASAGLLSQVTAWMGEISPGVRITTEALPGVSLARLSFSFASGRAVSRALRPTSVGFGLSYTLPLVVALLAAPAGSLILLENPEAHLHPRGQMSMGDLIARAAAAGVQVIVETHSDHLINGVRLAVKERRVAPERVGFHFFRRAVDIHDEDERIVHVVDSPRIDANGRIDVWPPGFFDQYDIALERLL